MRSLFSHQRKSSHGNSSSGESMRPFPLPPGSSSTAPWDTSAEGSATRCSSEERGPRARLIRLEDDLLPPGMADEGLAFSGYGKEGRLRVVIVGTGFAGLAAAIACARQNMSITVLERSSGLSPHGDSIVFGSNANRLLHRWGVGREMHERGASRGGWWLFQDHEGNKVWRENTDELVAKHGAPMLQGSRASFLASLGVEARMLGVDIRYDADVVQYYDSEEDPAVVLRTGEVVKGDVVLVADGVHSCARRLLAPHERQALPKQPSGYSIHRAVVSGEAIANDPECAYLLDGNIRTWLGPDAHVCTYPMDQGRRLAFTFTHPDDSQVASLDWRDKKPIGEALRRLSDVWDPTLRKAMGYFSSTLHWRILDEAPEEEWISAGGKICFLGDAVHAMMPTAFQGGSQAVEDAASIALCLATAGGDPAGVRIALEVHEALRHPTVQRAQALGRKQQDLWHAYSAAGGSIPPSSLRPLCFAVYSHDAEHFALANFYAIARALIPAAVVKREWVEQAARNAGIELGEVEAGVRNLRMKGAGVRWPEATR